ncbi:hypothetical protein FGB62_104g119 [Gracilaria domingensis]|nr:hypothetical protein FGB62_104g119 [Gracilaria domingensis]
MKPSRDMLERALFDVKAGQQRARCGRRPARFAIMPKGGQARRRCEQVEHCGRSGRRLFIGPVCALRTGCAHARCGCAWLFAHCDHRSDADV